MWVLCRNKVLAASKNVEAALANLDPAVSSPAAARRADFDEKPLCSNLLHKQSVAFAFASDIRDRT
jgi:hypothetical protein